MSTSEPHSEPEGGVRDPCKPALAYWRRRIVSDSRYRPDVEFMVVIQLDAHRKPQGHHFISVRTADTPFVHPREVFRVPIETEAASIVLLRHQTSQEPDATPEDIRLARQFKDAGELLRIDFLDYFIVARMRMISLRQIGCFP